MGIQKSGKKCCQDANADAFFAYTKAKIRDLGLAGQGGVRVNKSGCLGRCACGPSLVIYPEGTWYRYQTEADIDEIIARHVLKDEIVQHLLMDSDDSD